MRWLTPQELAKVSGRSERTLRHYASKGLIKVRKDGAAWKIDPLSAIAAGIEIPREFLESLKSPKEKGLPSSSGKSARSVNKTDEEQPPSEADRKYKRLRELGVYKDLLELYRIQNQTMTKQSLDYMRRCLQYIGLGFYEYSRDKKAEHFKQARAFLVSCLVEDDMDGSDKSEWRETVESSIIPGIIGLIRKQERRSHAKDTRNTEASHKSR